MFCTQCGEQLADSARFCFNCGEATQKTDLSLADDREPKIVMSQRDNLEVSEGAEPEPIINTKDALYHAAIGHKYEDYYRDGFDRFAREGNTGASWNWPAFFFSLYWMLYRKMWYPAAGYFLAGILITIIALPTAKDGAGVTTVDIVYLVGAFIIFPMYANALYYKKCNELIATARFNHPNPNEQLSYLKRKGRTSSIVWVLIALCVVLTLLGILGAITVPAYQDYSTRTHVQNAYNSSNEVTKAFKEYYERNQTIPQRLEQLFIGPQHIPNSLLKLDPDNGQITVSMYAGDLNGEALVLTPYLDNNQQIFWECKAAGISQRYLPNACSQ
ncbi:hypothetical protein MDMS009_2055 [Methylophaga thiooxydans DMS010]|uniref:Zinc-ribbon domain-containing protein n=2 Tax=Methylophaga thiooxydans TaxID=392484 RepID=C0N6G2_9GAMM|nr:hypothetical protein MDMS009_2055 [Methylophaga thiooxydans DMS010]